MRANGNARAGSARQALVLAVAAAGAVAAAARTARAATATWDGGAGSGDTKWQTALNWSPDAVPTATTDVVFGNAVAPGTFVLANALTPYDALANSLTINTGNPFTLDGGYSFGVGGLGGTIYSNLTLTSGDFTRVDTASDHVLDTNVFLADHGTWYIGGPGSVYTTLPIKEAAGGGPKDLTKTGAGALRSFIEVTGAVHINTGLFRGIANQAGTITVGVGGGGGSWELMGVPDPAPTIENPFPQPNVNAVPAAVTLVGKPGGFLIPTLTVVQSAVFSGPMTLQLNPTIRVDADKFLEVSGGIYNAGDNTNFLKAGPGDMIVSGAGTAGASVVQGRLIVKHSNAFGTGNVVAQDISGGVSRPTLAFGDGVATLANPITISRAWLAGVGTSTVQSNITLLHDHLNVEVTDAAHALTLNGNIAESGGSYRLNKTGDGALFLGGSNALSGGIEVVQGVFGATQDASLPAGVVTKLAANARFDMKGNTTLTRPLLHEGGPGFGGLGVLRSAAGNNTFAGQLTVPGDYALGAAPGATLTVAAPLAAPFALTKVDGGALRLTNAGNAFTSLTVAAGSLSMTGDAGVPVGMTINVNDGGAVSFYGNGTVSRAVKLAGHGPGAGVGALHNESGDNTYAGPLTILTDTTFSSAAGTLTVASGINAGSSTITKTGAGVVALSGPNVFGGATVAQGALAVLAPAALPAGQSVDVLPGGTLRVGSGVTAGAATPALRLRGGGSGGSGALAVAQGAGTYAGPVTFVAPASVGAGAGATLTVTGAIGDVDAADGDGDGHPDAPPPALTKVGPGTVVLKGANTYRGGTVIDAGTLAIDADGRLGAAGTPVTVNAAGKLRVTGWTFTTRSFALNGGSIAVDDQMFIAYDGSTISGGFLRGPGVHGFDGAPSTLGGVTVLPGAKVGIVGSAALRNVSNAGQIEAGGAVTWDGGFNLGGGSVVVHSTLDAEAFQNDGAITINAGGTLNNAGSDLASTGGSRITVQSGGTLALNGTQLNLHGALAVNDGTIAGGTTNVHFGSLLAGTGDFGAVVLHPGGAFTPGTTLANVPATAAAPSGLAAIDPLDANQTTSAPLQLNADAVAKVTAGEGALTIAGAVTGAGRTLTKVDAGTLAVAALHAGALRVDGGAVSVLPGGGATSTLDTLTVAAGARLDLADNKLVVAAGDLGTSDGSTYTGVTRLIQTAYQESAWTGAGLTTSMPDAATGLTTLAIATADQTGLTIFGGVPVSGDDVLVMYTYGGDTNFDGKLDADDYGTIDFSVLVAGSDGYYNGDFNYDGVVNADDYGVIDFNILAQTTPFPTGGGGGGGGGGAAAGVAGVAAVPEPSAIGVLLPCVAAVTRRARRRRLPRPA